MVVCVWKLGVTPLSQSPNLGLGEVANAAINDSARAALACEAGEHHVAKDASRHFTTRTSTTTTSPSWV